MDIGVFFVIVFLPFLVYAIWAKHRTLRRGDFIRGYAWPPGLLDKLVENNPTLGRKEAALISRGLRQYFIAYLKSDQRFVAMPSRIVDDLWHEFILYTREYQQFCQKAFGRFLHHIPASSMQKTGHRDTDGLSRVWLQACRDENIDPLAPTRLPLLFALDTKLNITDGFRYDLAPDGAAMALVGKLRGDRKGSGACGGGGACGGDGGCGGGCGGE